MTRKITEYLTSPQEVAKVLATSVVKTCEDHGGAFVLEILDATIDQLVDIYTERMKEHEDEPE